MDSSKKGTLVNASWGGWYPKGTDRLVRSMIHHGWDYNIMTWKDKIINEKFDHNYPYTVKAAAIEEAVNAGHTHILWMDCSLWVVKYPNTLMSIIDHEGGLFIKSGYNMAQTSADTDLEWAGVSRDQAEKMEELWSCVFGFSLEKEEGQEFYKQLMDALKHGVFNTPRTHSGRSQDERFLHARQDQTAVSYAFHKSGFTKLREPGEILSYYSETEEKDTIIKMRGM